jgi:hypothetical protein
MYRTLARDTSLWRAPLSSPVALVFVATFFQAYLSYSSAQLQDVTPPTLTAFSFTPTTSDTAVGPASVAVSVSATDNLAGVSFAKVSFQSPSGVQVSEASTSFSPATSVSGTIHVSFPQFSAVGTWTVVAVIISDAAGNHRYYSTTELAPLGFPIALLVAGKKM